MNGKIVAFALFYMIIEITAHSSFSGLIINGQARGDCVRPKYNPHLNWPVHIKQFYPNGIQSNNYSCGFLPEAGREASATCEVEAGATIGAAWSNPWEADIYPIMIEEHRGPIWVYLARHDHGNGGIPAGNKWFKIAQFGFTGTYKKSDNWEKVDWACPYTLWKDTGTISMPGYPNCQYGAQKFQIPADLAPGDYLLRTEIATLQNTGMGTGYAQLYVHCAQIRIKGSGNADPDGSYKVSFPGAYGEDHPGLNYVLWRDYANPYQFPGPSVYVAQPPAPPPTPAPVNPTPSPAPVPTPAPTTPFPSGSNSFLQSGYLLAQGASLVDPLGNYALILQSDGNLVLYDTSRNAIWATGTSDGQDNAPLMYALSVQNDGNIVIYKTRPELQGVWNSGTANKGVAPFYLTLGSDRNIILFDKTSKALWSSKTGVELGVNLQIFNNATGGHQFNNVTIESGAADPFELNVSSSEVLKINVFFVALVVIFSLF